MKTTDPENYEGAKNNTVEKLWRGIENNEFACLMLELARNWD